MMKKTAGLNALTITLRFSSLITLAFLVILAGFTFSKSYGASITYVEDMTDFPNPERGFWNSNGTVTRKYYYIDRNGPLSQSFLASMEKVFNDCRNSKRKLIPRFAYRSPDPALPAMLAQIEQLRPIFERHSDVIPVVEAGFIGEWGEWHSSPNFDKENFPAKKEVLFKLLDVVPKNRMVALRYNVDKRGIFETNVPLSITEAFSGSNRARTAAHNDCFVTNEHDAATYKKEGLFKGWGLGIEAEKTFLSADNLYVAQCGESCQAGSTSYASCERALADMARMRWDMINESFHQGVISQWKSQGCYDEIRRRLGYRIVLINATFDDEVTDGTLDGTLQLKNVGFGKIFNERKFELVLSKKGTTTEFTLPVEIDPRFWSPGQTQTIPIKVGIPKEVLWDTYSLHLALHDPAPKLYGIPEYAIRLANKDVWNAEKGYNSLMHTVKISSHGPKITAINNRLNAKIRSGINGIKTTVNSRTVEISFALIRPSPVRITMHCLSGKLVSTLYDQVSTAGTHHVTWNRLDRLGRLQPPGAYFISCIADGSREISHVIVR